MKVSPLPATLGRRSFLGALAALLPAVLGQRSLAAQPQPEREGMLNDAAEDAMERGLAYLASRQNDNGSFGRGGYAMNVAVVSLGALAFMSRGVTPGRGKYGLQVNRCIEYVLANSQQSGLLTAPAYVGQGAMYGHGFATLLLAEAFGMYHDPRLRDRLARAVQLIVNTQNDEGGWRYEPRRYEADISVTICEVMALRAARNAGIFVPTETIDRCTQYVKRCQNPDGGFMYMLSQPGPSEFPRTAAGIVALFSAGIYEGEEIERGIRYLMEHAPHRNPASGERYYFYGQYYAAQAMYQVGGDMWREWYPAVRDQLLQRQKREGDWFDSICPEYGTAMAVLVLQMPNNYLPIFQR